MCVMFETPTGFNTPCNFASEELKQVALKELHYAIYLTTRGNQSEFCRMFGISRSALRNYLRQVSDIKPCLARCLEQYTNGRVKAAKLLGLVLD